MKSFNKILGFLLSAALLLALFVFPNEVQQFAVATVGEQSAGWLLGSGTTILGAVTAFGNLKRQDRQLPNLGGAVKLLLLDESRFSADWPTLAQTATGEITDAPTLVSSPSFANVIFDLNSCSFKSSKSGDLGYQYYEHELEAELAGLTVDQGEELGKMLNLGCVAIATFADGLRVVIGASYAPLTLTDDFSSGAKAGDKRKTTLKGKTERGLAFRVTPLASS